MNEIVPFDEAGPPGRRPERTPMDTIPKARRTLERFIRAFYAGNLDDSTFRGLVYGMSQLLAYLKAEREEALEERLAALESILASKGSDSKGRM